MTQPVNQVINKFLAGLSRADIHPDTRKQATERVEFLIGEFERRVENRIEGGRAVRKAPRKLVRTTLKHLIRATKDAKPDARSSTSREARKLLRAIRTFQNFEAMEEKARDFAGLRWKETRRQNQRRLRERALSIGISESLVLRQLVVVDDLRSVCLALRLCAHDPDFGYLEALKNGWKDFWAIQRGDRPIALLSIERDRTVREADGFDHEPIGLPRFIMLEVLRRLRASADYCEAFYSVGAYSLFLSDSVPEPANIEFDGHAYRVWGRDDEIVISRDEDHWSRFRWDDLNIDGWDADYGNDISLGRLADLLSCCPSFAEVIRRHRPPQASE